MVDKSFSMSSFLALRYMEKSGVDFTDKLPYRHPSLPSDDERILVHTAEDIGNAIEEQLSKIRGGGGGTREQAFYSPEVWIQQSWHPTCRVVTHIHSAF